MVFWKYLTAVALFSLAACQTMSNTRGSGQHVYDLSGTTWTLIGYGSNAEATDLVEVALYAYTMSFDGNGSASFKFDCNRGTGSWKAVSEGSEGKVFFEHIAMTSAVCPTGSIGEQLSRDLPKAIGYSIYDGRLTMRFENTDTTYVWDGVD